MSTDPPTAREELERARLERSSHLNPLWLVALAALLAAGWLVWHGMIPEGELIRVRFDEGQGIEVDDTRLKCLGVVFGRVEGMELDEERGSVWVDIRLERDAEWLAVEGSEFRIIRAVFDLADVRHLATLLTGPYIEVRPGSGLPATEFDMRTHPATVQEHDGSRMIVLLALERGNVSEGTPVTFRGVRVGEVVDVELGDDARAVRMLAQVEARYAPLVRENTHFWRSGELDAQIGFRGVRLEADSLRAMLSGGITFNVPDGSRPAARDGAAFQLHESPEEEWRHWFPSIPLPAVEAGGAHVRRPDAQAAHGDGKGEARDP